MALPTLADLKAYVRREDAADDATLTLLLAHAQAVVERHLGVPLVAASKTLYDRGEEALRGSRSVRSLLLDAYPASITSITDFTGLVLDSSLDYDAADTPSSGIVWARPGTGFSNFPYTIVANVGLSVHPDYASRLEAMASRIIVDAAAWWYQARNPAASGETDPGVSTQYVLEGLPPRIQVAIRGLAPLRV